MLFHLVPAAFRLGLPFARYLRACIKALEVRLAEAPNKQTDALRMNPKLNGHMKKCSKRLEAQLEEAALGAPAPKI